MTWLIIIILLWIIYNTTQGATLNTKISNIESALGFGAAAPTAGTPVTVATTPA